MKTYILKTKLLWDKKVWREIEIAADASLYELAKVIITDAFGFDDFEHCFGFFSEITEGYYYDSEKQFELFTDLIEEGEDLEPTDSGNVKKTKVKDVWRNPGDKMMFMFDYGDDWRFVVELKGFGEKQPKQKYPRLIKAVGEAPEQYPEIDE